MTVGRNRKVHHNPGIQEYNEREKSVQEPSFPCQWHFSRTFLNVRNLKTVGVRKAFSSYEIPPAIVQECMERFNSISARKQVHLICVSGLSVITGNEMVDNLLRSVVILIPIDARPLFAVGSDTIEGDTAKKGEEG